MDNATPKYSKFDIANWFLINSKNKDVTPKKLQKLMYYAYAWGLVFLNDPETELEAEGNELKLNKKLFDGEFQAWVHGPVDRGLYAQYAFYGSNLIPIPHDKASIDIKSKDDLDILKEVNEAYGDFTGNELERLTHQDAPWQNARGNAKPLDIVQKVISDKDMYEFYGAKLK